MNFQPIRWFSQRKNASDQLPHANSPQVFNPPTPPAGRTPSDVTLASTQRAPLVPRTSSSVGTDAASARGKSATKSTTAETEPTSSRTTTVVSETPPSSQKNPDESQGSGPDEGGVCGRFCLRRLSPFVSRRAALQRGQLQPEQRRLLPEVSDGQRPGPLHLPHRIPPDGRRQGLPRCHACLRGSARARAPCKHTPEQTRTRLMSETLISLKVPAPPVLAWVCEET